VITKAQRETRFHARAVRVDSTVIEADIRYPSDAMLALQGTKTLAREGSKLAGMVKGATAKVRDRSRSVAKTVRAISRTLSRRTGLAKAKVIELNSKAGAQIARSAREARRLAAEARQAARGQGAQAKLRAAAKLEELAGRCQQVSEQIDRRARGLKISDRLVSISDPDARPIRKGKLGKPTEFGYVAQICEVTENTNGARAGSCCRPPRWRATRPRTACCQRRPPSSKRSACTRASWSAMAASRPPPRSRRSPAWRPHRSSYRAATSPAPDAPASDARATARGSRAASATSNAATG